LLEHVEENPYEITRRTKVDEAVKNLMATQPVENKIYQGIPREERFHVIFE